VPVFAVKLFLAIRALFFVALLPGVVAGYVPYRMLLASDKLRVPAVGAASVAAAALILLGALVLLRCVWDFFARGKGTLAPIDPPRNLVVSGLYRYTRNPMYNGVLAVLVGEAWLFNSTSILTYAAFVLVFPHDAQPSRPGLFRLAVTLTVIAVCYLVMAWETLLSWPNG
jgi:protein-S-isoprenylcysteine O-methyltransferase Ste14